MCILSFKDTGIFVKEFVANGDDGSEFAFKTEESVDIVEEVDKSYIVERDLQRYQVPKDVVLRTSKKSNTYIVAQDNTQLMDKPDGRKIKALNVGDRVYLEKVEGEYGFFNAEDGIKGYIFLSSLEKESTEAEMLTVGISAVSKTLQGKDNTYFVLTKGEPVLVKDFKNGKFIILDQNAQEFEVPKEHISLRNSRQVASRSSISRRASSLSLLVQNAHKTLGKPYVGGGTGKEGYDCSGLTYSLYLNTLNIKLNRSSRDQVKNGVEVSKSELIPGDLIFFRTSGEGIGHVGLYIGDNNMIHASSGSGKVVITDIDSKYYKQRYVTSRRIISN